MQLGDKQNDKHTKNIENEVDELLVMSLKVNQK